MPANTILDKTSFSILDPAGQETVRALFNATYMQNNTLALDHLPLFRQRKSLTVLLEFYGAKLDKVNPVIFHYMNKHQKAVLEQDLLFSFYIFSAQYQLDESEHRRQGLHERSNQILKCAFLINELRKSSQIITPPTILAGAIDYSGKHVKYLGLTVVAPMVVERMMDVCNGKAIDAEDWKRAGKTVVVKDWMGEVNIRRLYWVWAGNLVSTVISLLPEEFTRRSLAQEAIAAPAPITGYMSWILYYARFGINLSLLLKHTIKGPWMSKKERELQIPAWERFKTQWDQRKFSLLNDSIWATANMACFLWLTGRGMLGYSGNVLTAVLLLMDVSLTAWRFYEECTQHNVDKQRYDRDIRDINALLQTTLADEEKQILKLQLEGLEKAQKKAEFDWRYKKYSLVNDLVYASSLLVAFTVMCCFLFPPAAIVPATALILGIVGAALCFVLNMAYAAVSGGLEIAKSKESKQLAKEDFDALVLQFKGTNEPFVKRQLYLDMKQLIADSDYQKRLIQFQKMKLVQNVLIDALVPPLVFVAFIFMPLGIGIAVLAAGLVLAIASNLILNRYMPKKGNLPELNEEEYDKFARLPNPTFADLKIDTKPSGQEKPGFFSKCKGSGPQQLPPAAEILPAK